MSHNLETIMNFPPAFWLALGVVWLGMVVACVISNIKPKN